METTIGIVDIGSNTVRLVIYQQVPNYRTYRRIENIKIMARLRSYFTEEQTLSEEGIHSLLTIMKDFVEVAKHYAVTEFICVATASIRLAKNQQDIVRRVEAITSTPIRLLSEEQEARYGFLAVTHSMSLPTALTIDIGGGSTEITYFENQQVQKTHSFPFGALSLQMQFVKGERATQREQEKIAAYVHKQVKKLSWLHQPTVPLIAIGGSARNIATLHQQFTDYPLHDVHQYEMTAEGLEHVEKRLEPLSLHEIGQLDGCDKERADTILPALSVFKTVMQVAQTNEFIVSAKGLRDGVLFERQNQHRPSLLDTSMMELKEQFYLGKEREPSLLPLTTKLLLSLQTTGLPELQLSEKEHLLIHYAARIYNLGKIADAETSNLTFFLVSQQTLYGLSHSDRIRLALLASFKNRTLFKTYIAPFHHWFTKEEQQRLSLLGAILKLAQTLNRSTPPVVESISCHLQKEATIHIDVYCSSYYRPEEFHFLAQKKHIEKISKQTITAQFHLQK